MNKDSHSIYETYKTTSANQEIIQEGLFDRLKARGSQAVGSAKGLGTQAIGGAQKLAGKAVGKVGGALGSKSAGTIGSEITKSGESKVTSGKMMGDVAKFKSYIKNTVDTTVGDLKKLNMPIKDEAVLRKQLTALIVSQLPNVAPSGQFRSASGKLGGRVA